MHGGQRLAGDRASFGRGRPRVRPGRATALGRAWGAFALVPRRSIYLSAGPSRDRPSARLIGRHRSLKSLTCALPTAYQKLFGVLFRGKGLRSTDRNTYEYVPTHTYLPTHIRTREFKTDSTLLYHGVIMHRNKFSKVCKYPKFLCQRFGEGRPSLALSGNATVTHAVHGLKQKAQLSPRDRAMRRVSWNLANCHATVQYDKSWTNRSYEVGGLKWADV